MTLPFHGITVAGVAITVVGRHMSFNKRAIRVLASVGRHVESLCALRELILRNGCHCFFISITLKQNDLHEKGNSRVRHLGAETELAEQR